MSICRPGTVAVPVASGIDKSKVWYPTALCVQIATSETDFVRSLPHGYLSFAEAMAADPSSPTVPTVVTATGEPAKRLIVPSPVAYLPPANDHLFAVEHGATVNCLPTSWSHHSYFEAHFTPASPIVGLGIQRGGLHLMWVATRGVEMLVSFSAGTTFLETLEASTAWTELVPAALRAAARGDLGIKNDMADTVWLQWERKEAASDSKSSWTPTATATGPSDPLESTQWMGVHAVAIDSDTSSPLLSAPTTEAMTLGFGFGANWSDPTPTDDDELGAGTGLPIRANGQVEVVILRRSKAHGTKNPCAVSRIIIGRLVPDNRLSRYTVPVLIGGGQDSVVAFSEDAAGRPLALGVDVI
ncbi:hypothetical protein BC828DRAFT_410158 [Blastocladiella britannica]|nr:hypothetical protein BC828DRAFT_410158 [Blastocladiella britannica]